MTGDLPPGPWSDLLVGHLWPAASSLAVLGTAAALRQENQIAHDSYADVLASIARVTLSAQDGATADSARARFTAGERHARGVAERNRIKEQSYRSAITSTESLRHDLADIADRGSSAIEAVVSSAAPAPAKISAVTDVVAAAHAEAAARAALHADSVYSALQTIVDADGLAPSARAFAASHGLGFVAAPSAHPEAIAGRICAAARQTPTPQ